MVKREQVPVSDTAPWPFRLGKFMQQHGIRGGHRFIVAASALGLLSIRVRYQLAPNIEFQVDLSRRENRWTREAVLAYERALIDRFAARLRTWDEPVRLVDCGADIGIIATLLAMRLPLEEVISFEPNPRAFCVLVDNVKALPCRGVAHRMGVADFTGRGVLKSPPHQAVGDHAKYVAPEDGPDAFDVTSIDELHLRGLGTLGMKIDVEGGELKVLQGAERTLRETPHWVVVFEAHPLVFQRTGVDPCEILRWLMGIRRIEHELAASDDPIDVGRPFFSQFTEKSDIICWTA